jgi:hypothetical protein
MNPSAQSAPHTEVVDWSPYPVLFLALALALVLFPLHAGSFGTLDFIQYWTAWDLMCQGKNPYDSTLLSEAQVALTSGATPLVYSWNPPWTYTLLAPFLALPFSKSATTWLIFEIGALLFITAKTPQAFKIPSLGPVWSAVAILAFLPTLYTLRYGQLGILFALSLTCFLLALDKSNYRLAGLSLLPLSAKPHLFMLCIIPGVVWLFQLPRAAKREFLVGVIGGIVMLFSLTLVIAPLTFQWWIESMTADVTSTSGIVPFQNWMAHTTVTGIRILAIALTGDNPSWPLVVIPLLSCMATSIYFFVRRPTIRWNTILLPILCLSLATASYGWVFDQTVLASCQYLLFAHALSRSRAALRYVIIVVTISVQAIPLALTATSIMFFHYFFLLPWIYLALLFAIFALKDKPNHEATIAAADVSVIRS